MLTLPAFSIIIPIMTTHYETLGVAENTSPDDIKKAYRRLASKHHPDKGGDNATFQNIQIAYDTLSDPQRRQQYDHERKFGPQGPGGMHFQWHHNGPGASDINDIFRQFGFGASSPFEMHFGQQRPQQRRNKDLKIEIPVPLVSTLEEQKKTVNVRTTNGEHSTVEVTIPRGVTNGTVIKYPGLGDNLFNTIARGDLYVHINVHNAEGYIANGIDLYTQINVNCLLAITGGEVVVKGIDDRLFKLTVPPGSQPSTKFRIPNQGLFQMSTDNRGDLYITLGITVPQNLNVEQLETVRSINSTL